MTDNNIDQKQVLFLGLIQSFVTSAWIQLGKQKNPITDKTEVNLDEAQFTIDMLEMIKEKTEGNLNEKEAQILSNSLSELKMNFIDLKMKQDSHPEQQEEPKPENN
ncbi:MAG: DUF1844 domain-containing protein [Candidatus Marinimicrobia bacterium]|nr:DUF1844 domain-containing protein [Candidatus Neomarinimicrobiota bacterium]MBL7066239.1 DUF1844 domain-containing protein [Candidatus Neomarinimicrobiota bacterium]